MKAHIFFLGTGGSAGIPMIGCSCSVCRSDSLRNKRLRPSMLIQFEGKNFVIDATPDFRQQALTYNIDHLEGMLLTHAHYDHIGGLTECVPYLSMQKKPIPLLLSKQTYAEVKKQYHYLLAMELFSAQILKSRIGMVSFEGLNVRYFSYLQKGMWVNGFRLKNFAYLTDIKEYDDTLIFHLEGVDTLVISATLFSQSRAHIHFLEAQMIAKQARIKRTFFTHISHHIEHEKENKKLPKGVEIAYDGLKLEVEIEKAR